VLVNRLFFFLFRFSLCWITYIYTRLTKGPTRNSHLLCLCEIVTIKKKKKKARKKSFFIFFLFLFFTSVFSGAQKNFFLRVTYASNAEKHGQKKKLSIFENVITPLIMHPFSCIAHHSKASARRYPLVLTPKP
jgi:hypothetical protein